MAQDIKLNYSMQKKKQSAAALGNMRNIREKEKQICVRTEYRCKINKKGDTTARENIHFRKRENIHFRKIELINLLKTNLIYFFQKIEFTSPNKLSSFI